MDTPAYDLPRIRPTSDISTASDLRQHLREKLDQITQTGRPLFVTTNGQPEAVVMSTQVYDELMDKADLADSLASLKRGMEDVKAGRVRDFRTAMHDIAKELGLTLKA